MFATSRTDEFKLTRKSILKKTSQVSGSTLLSRFLGIFRETLMIRFLGPSALSDAFITAYKIPNSLRKVFAEGALSAAVLPTIVQAVRSHGKQSISSLITLLFIIFESMVFLMCALIMALSHTIVWFVAPGFSPEQVAYGAMFLTILMPFLFFVSVSALLAGPLQAVGHFFVPAFGPVLLNIVYIGALLVCLTFNLSVTFLCWAILVGGGLMVVAHLIAYVRLGFGFSSINRKDLSQVWHILQKFFWCFLSMSVMEAEFVIATSFASYLPKGSVTLISHATRFTAIPLGVFAAAFSTILLPHFSRISLYAPKRMSFYLLETLKLVWWVMVPVTFAMIFFARSIFLTLFLSENYTLAKVDEVSVILIAYSIGLFCFAMNKILLSVYYSLHETKLPGFVSVLVVVLNTVLNWILIGRFNATGLAMATTIAGIVQTGLLLAGLAVFYKFKLYRNYLSFFMLRSSLQAFIVGAFAVVLYYIGWSSIAYLPESMVYFFREQIGFWFWVGPLCCAYAFTLYKTRSLFNLHLVFLE